MVKKEPKEATLKDLAKSIAISLDEIAGHLARTNVELSMLRATWKSLKPATETPATEEVEE